MAARSRRISRPLDRVDRPEEDDLLTPTFDVGFDVRRFDPLYHPQSILLACFFGGPMAGAILFGLNYKWMKLVREARLTWLSGILVALLLIIPCMWAAEHEGDFAFAKQLLGFAKYAYMGGSVVFGWVLARRQHANFVAYENARRKRRDLLWPAVFACLAGLGSTFVLATVVLIVLKAAL